jgi:hypothetical protein
MRGQVYSFQLLLGIPSTVFLRLSAVVLMSIILLPVIEREREERKWGVVVRETTLRLGSRKQYLWFRRFPASAR